MPYFAPRPRFQSVSSTATLSRESSPSPPVLDDARAEFVLHTQPSTSFRRSVSGLHRTPDQQGWYTPSPPPRSRAPSPSSTFDSDEGDASPNHFMAWSPEPEPDSPTTSSAGSTVRGGGGGASSCNTTVSPPTSVSPLPSIVSAFKVSAVASAPLGTAAPTPTPTSTTAATSAQPTQTPRVCDQCRLRKIRCHRIHMDDSPCQTCIRRKKTCTWGNVDPPARRGKAKKLATASAGSTGFKGALAQRRRKKQNAQQTRRSTKITIAKNKVVPPPLEVCVVVAPDNERSASPETTSCPSSPPPSSVVDVRDTRMFVPEEEEDEDSDGDEDMERHNDNYEVESSAGSLSSTGYEW